jgi:hypothetical protein
MDFGVAIRADRRRPAPISFLSIFYFKLYSINSVISIVPRPLFYMIYWIVLGTYY